MRILSIVLSLVGLVTAATPSVACMYHDQQASSDAQQQTAQAQPASQTTTQ